jgi:hypothetical protein
MPEYLLIAFADISEEHLQYQDLELQEIRDRALKNTIRDKYVRLIEHGGTTYQSLANLLNSEEGDKITMFHYSGHSSKEGLWVQWKDGSGAIEVDLINTLFKAHKKIRFVFLNSCYSEATAKVLVASGVSYVIGTTSKIKDKQAALVAGKFYEYLSGKGKSIKKAFDLTTAFFKSASYSEDAGVKEAFRSFNIEDPLPSEHPWQLYQSDSQEEEKTSWSLVPASNLALSTNKEKRFHLRVFCFYEASAEQLYKLLKFHFKGKGILFNGIEDITLGARPEIDDLVKECTAADIILHLLSDVKYIELWDKEINDLITICKSKTNIALNWLDEYKAPLENLQQMGVSFKAIFPKIYPFADSVQKLSNLRIPLAEIVDKALAPELLTFFSQFLIDPEALENALQEFDYYSEFTDYYTTCDPSKKILFFLIEGTVNCAQILLYKKFLKKANIENNIQPVRVPFVSPNGTITSQGQFYLFLAKELLQTTTTKDSYKTPERCIEEIDLKLGKQPVVILIEGIDEVSDGTKISDGELQFRKGLLANFWVYLNKNLSDTIRYPLLIFVINKSYPDVRFEAVSPYERKDCWPDKILINKLNQLEYLRWFDLFKKRFVAENFQALKNYESEIVDKYREISLRKICEKLVPGEPIVEKLLKP